MRTTAPGQSSLLLLDVIDIFNDKRIPYAIIGAFAASYYGMVRASLDADALVSLSAEQGAEDLCAILRAKGFSVEYRTGDLNDPVTGVISFTDRFHNRVDLLTGIRGMSPQAFLRVREAIFMGVSVKVVGLEDFIAMKVFAGSPKDIADALGVLKVSGQEIDQVLLNKLAAGFGQESLKLLGELIKNNS